MGDLLTANSWAYFAALHSHGALAGLYGKTIDQPGLAYGLFHAVVQPNKLFGVITTSIKFAGAMMDVGHLRYVRWNKNGDQEAWVNYNRARGHFASALEHATPERLFVDATACNIPGGASFDPAKPMCPEGISAVKAIFTAQSEGQKVYTITQGNRQIIDGLSVRSETKEEISNAVASGKEVTVHERQIAKNDWACVGYTVIDSQTGAGAYLIEGGANGAVFTLGWLGGFLVGAGLLFTTVVGWIPVLVGLLFMVAAGLLGSLLASENPAHLSEFQQAFFVGVISGLVTGLLSRFGVPTTQIEVGLAYLATLFIYNGFP